MGTKKITVESKNKAPIEKVWKLWTKPEHIVNWNFASDDWHAPSATNDFKVGGIFSTRMEAKDGSFGFDFWGIYNEIKEFKKISYTLGDDRKVEIIFTVNENHTHIIETFDTEQENPIEMQQTGWQAILDHFKKYVESQP